VFTRFGVDIFAEGIDSTKLNRQELGDNIFEKLRERYNAKEQLISADAMRHHERLIMLSVLDQQWKDHLLNMDHLKEGIGLRGYAQHDPLVEYKRESFEMFEAMMRRFEEETVRYLYLMQVLDAEEAERLRQQQEMNQQDMRFTGANKDGSASDTGARLTSGDGNGRGPRRAATSVDDMEAAFQRRKRRELEQASMAGSGDMQQVQQVVRSSERVGPNEPCPCGSGQKYKKCHGRR
jgi:preprotein translocase subunit SecA